MSPDGFLVNGHAYLTIMCSVNFCCAGCYAHPALWIYQQIASESSPCTRQRPANDTCAYHALPFPVSWLKIAFFSQAGVAKEMVLRNQNLTSGSAAGNDLLSRLSEFAICGLKPSHLLIRLPPTVVAQKNGHISEGEMMDHVRVVTFPC